MRSPPAPPAKAPAFVSCVQTVERLWARLKEWRAIATRYEKTASSFMHQARRPASEKGGRSGHHRSTLRRPLVHRILEDADDFFCEGGVVARHAVHRSHSGRHRGGDPLFDGLLREGVVRHSAIPKTSPNSGEFFEFHESRT